MRVLVTSFHVPLSVYIVFKLINLKVAVAMGVVVAVAVAVAVIKTSRFEKVVIVSATTAFIILIFQSWLKLQCQYLKTDRSEKTATATATATFFIWV